MTLTDTAGLRSQTEDVIEQEGIKIAKDELMRAHSVLLVLDISEFKIKKGEQSLQVVLDSSQETSIGSIVQQAREKQIIALLNKSDLLKDLNENVTAEIKLQDGTTIPASLVSFTSEDSAQNIELVSDRLKTVIKRQGLVEAKDMIVDENAADNFLVTRHRHKVLLE